MKYAMVVDTYMPVATKVSVAVVQERAKYIQITDFANLWSYCKVARQNRKGFTMILMKELHVQAGATPIWQYHRCRRWVEDHNLPLYCAPVQRSAAGLLTLMLLIVLSMAGCADRPQAKHDEAHEPCVVPRGGFDCGDQVKQEKGFMRFEQQGHQLP